MTCWRGLGCWALCGSHSAWRHGRAGRDTTRGLAPHSHSRARGATTITHRHSIAQHRTQESDPSDMKGGGVGSTALSHMTIAIGVPTDSDRSNQALIYASFCFDCHVCCAVFCPSYLEDHVGEFGVLLLVEPLVPKHLTRPQHHHSTLLTTLHLRHNSHKEGISFSFTPHDACGYRCAGLKLCLSMCKVPTCVGVW